MCGILGSLPRRQDHLFSTALSTLDHRGPDGKGVWHSNDMDISLGHTRLSVLDTSDRGKQPMHRNNLTIVFNGEIYNFLEIRDELKKQGAQFITETDTEVILAAFEAWGVKCLNKFNGMWSFAIWDRKKKSLLLSKDRFGKKPLFYTFYRGTFIFASEMKALFPFLDRIEISKDFNWCASNIFFYETTDKCLIEGIKRFPMAHYAYIQCNDTELKAIRYYDTIDELVTVPKKYAEQVEVFRELFFDACRLRMRSDVPIATALSGGMDSSAVTCALAEIGKSNFGSRVSQDWQHAFSACYPGNGLDEREYIELVAEKTGIHTTFIDIEPPLFENIFQDLYLFEELYITSPIPMMHTYAAMRRKGIKVTLDGHGADELFSGYGSSICLACLDCGLNFKKIKEVISTYNNTLHQDYMASTNNDSIWSSYGEIMANVSTRGIRFIPDWLKPMWGVLISNLRGDWHENPSKGKFGKLNQWLYDLFHYQTLPTLLRNYDHYSMANGVEVRAPFVDHRLVAFMFSLPWESKLGGGYTKRILRDALRPFMPKRVVERKMKVGFSTPFMQWMKGAWKAPLLDMISSRDFLECDLIDGRSVGKRIRDTIYSDKTLEATGDEIWTLIVPYLWEQALLKQRMVYPPS